MNLPSNLFDTPINEPPVEVHLPVGTYLQLMDLSHSSGLDMDTLLVLAVRLFKANHLRVMAPAPAPRSLETPFL